MNKDVPCVLGMWLPRDILWHNPHINMTACWPPLTPPKRIRYDGSVFLEDSLRDAVPIEDTAPTQVGRGAGVCRELPAAVGFVMELWPLGAPVQPHSPLHAHLPLDEDGYRYFIVAVVHNILETHAGRHLPIGCLLVSMGFDMPIIQKAMSIGKRRHDLGVFLQPWNFSAHFETCLNLIIQAGHHADTHAPPAAPHRIADVTRPQGLQLLRYYGLRDGAIAVLHATLGQQHGPPICTASGDSAHFMVRRYCSNVYALLSDVLGV